MDHPAIHVAISVPDSCSFHASRIRRKNGGFVRRAAWRGEPDCHVATVAPQYGSVVSGAGVVVGAGVGASVAVGVGVAVGAVVAVPAP